MTTTPVDEFFAALVSRALAKARGAPRLERVVPHGEGYSLVFRVADGSADEVTVDRKPGPASRHAALWSYRLSQHPSPQRRKHLQRVGHLLAKALAQGSPEGVSPPAWEAAPPPLEPLPIRLRGDCDRACIFCGNTLQERPDRLRLPVVPSAPDHPERLAVERVLRENAPRAAALSIGWSGRDGVASPEFDAALELAYSLGYRDMGIQTPGSRLAEPGFLEKLRAHGVTRVGLTAHAADEATFDHLAGLPGAYRLFHDTLPRLVEAGFEVSVTAPCVALTVDDLPRHLAALAAGPAHVSCFYWYPDEAMTPRFPALGVTFARAVEALEEARALTPPRRIGVDGIPRCVARPELVEHFFWSYGEGHSNGPFVSFERVGACGSCGEAQRCPGAPVVSLKYHGPWRGTPV